MNKLTDQIDTVFVKPSIHMFDNLEELRKYKDEYEIWSFLDRRKKTRIETVFDNRLSLLIGEPGFGKTYLLQRIVRLAEIQKFKRAIFAPLRSFIPNDTIETIINRQSEQSDAIKTASFKLQNSNNIIICLKNQFNRRELLVNSICKCDETHFDKIRFSAKMEAVFQS